MNTLTDTPITYKDTLARETAASYQEQLGSIYDHLGNEGIIFLPYSAPLIKQTTSKPLHYFIHFLGYAYDSIEHTYRTSTQFKRPSILYREHWYAIYTKPPLTKRQEDSELLTILKNLSQTYALHPLLYVNPQGESFKLNLTPDYDMQNADLTTAAEIMLNEAESMRTFSPEVYIQFHEQLDKPDFTFSPAVPTFNGIYQPIFLGWLYERIHKLLLNYVDGIERLERT